MLEVSEAEAESLAQQSKMASTEGLTRIMEVLADTEMRLRDAASKKILIEVALLKAIEARNAVSLDSVLKQLHELRDAKGGEVVTLPMPASAPTPGPKPVRAETTAAYSLQAQSVTPSESFELCDLSSPSPPLEERVGERRPILLDLEQLWTALVDAVGRASPFTRTYLLGAHPVSFEKNVFVIGFDPEVEDHLSLVDNAKNHNLLQTKLLELGHANAQIKFIKAEAPVGRRPALPQVTSPPEALSEPTPAATKPPGPARSAVPAAPAKDRLAAVPFNKDDFKNDPLIQKALEIFKGQIVEVRA